MKSSITTRSSPPRLLPPSSTSPLVIRTKKTSSPASKATPRNERVSSPLAAGTKPLNKSAPLTSKYSIFVLLARSTSVKTLPNPLVVAACAVPGMKKRTSVIGLASAVNSRGRLKTANFFDASGRSSPNSIGATPSLALTRKPVPGVKKTTPRGEFLLKKLAGRLFGAANASGTPSQLISRRPSGNEPPTLLSLPPRKSRNSWTAAWISAGADPEASKTTGAANVIVGQAKVIVAKAMDSQATFRSIDAPPVFENPLGLFMHLSLSAGSSDQSALVDQLRMDAANVSVRPTGYRGETFVTQPRISGNGGDDPHLGGADAAMERYARGDEAAFAELYDAIAPRLLGFLRKATRDAFAAEDLMQQTLLQMHRARGSFIPGAPVLPWAFAIARRLMTDHARRRRVELRLFSEAAADDDRIAYEPTAT